MYIKLSTKRDIDRNSADRTADVIRDIVKAMTTPNLTTAALNPVVVNVVQSAVIDNSAPGWTLIASTKDGVTLGSGSGFELGDSWTVSKAGKQLVFYIADTSAGNYGNYGIEVTSTTNPAPAALFPGNDIFLLTGAGSSVTVSGKPGTSYVL